MHRVGSFSKLLRSEAETGRHVHSRGQSEANNSCKAERARMSASGWARMSRRGGVLV